MRVAGNHGFMGARPALKRMQGLGLGNLTGRLQRLRLVTHRQRASRYLSTEKLDLCHV